MKQIIVFILVVVSALFSSCIFDNNSSEKDDATESEVVFTQEVMADKGAVIEAFGYKVEIPPDALPEDTKITAVPVPPQDTSTEQILGGINFGPSGLKLNKPAIIEVPIELPPDWTPGELVPIYEFPSNDPSLAVWNGYYAEITTKDGKYIASGPVFHFSGSLFIRNCHSGTMEYILNEFKSRGCHSDTAIARIKEKYPDLSNINIGTEKVIDKDIQRLLGTFFEEKYTFNRGSDVPSDVISELSQFTEDGSLVAVAFTSETWSNKNADGMYSCVPHTAILEQKDGTIQIRNSANVRPNRKLINAMGGTNLVYYDWGKINEFRELQAGVGVELTCGVQPGDFSAPDMNPYGLSIYNPLNGKDWTEIAWEDPMAFMSCVLARNWSSISGIPPRPRPWTAVKIYVLKASPDKNPCEKDDESKTEELDISVLDHGAIWLIGYEINDLEASLKLNKSMGWVADGSTNGNTFTGHKTYTDLYGYKTVTDFTVTIDTVNRFVTVFNGTLVQTNAQGQEIERLEITGTNLALTEFDPSINSMEFKVYGSDVREKLSYVLNRKTWYNDYRKQWVSVEANLDDLSFPAKFPNTAYLFISFGDYK